MAEKFIAKCYLTVADDENNKCELTDQRLIVTKNKRKWEFAINKVKELSVLQRKLLIPIVFGGVFTPLIIIGFFNGMFHPAIAVLLIISGTFFFYLGWLGQKMMYIDFLPGSVDIPIDYPTENLMAFIDYANHYIQHQPPEKTAIYCFLERELQEHEIIDYINRNLDHIGFYFYTDMTRVIGEQLHEGKLMIAAIDPLKSGTEIKYQKRTGDDTLRAVIKGHIRKEALIGGYDKNSFFRLIE